MKTNEDTIWRIKISDCSTINFVIAEQEVIKNWFVECWKKANGKEVKLPSYLSFHDEYKSYDLMNNKWIIEDEMWSY